MLYGTVGVQELTGQVNNGVAVPVHPQAGFCLYGCHDRSFQIFLAGFLDELVGIFCGNYHCHTFLRFADRDLCAVQTVILFRYGVQVDLQTVGQFADRNGNAACTEVVAAFDHLCHSGIAEQTLEFAFFRSVTLLDFCTAVSQRFHGVGLGRTGRTAAAVTSGLAAQQNDNIAGDGGFSADIGSRSSTQYRTDLHTLRHVAGVVYLCHVAGCQTDLVAVGAVAVGSTHGDLSLGQLAGNGILYRHQRIGCTGDTHCLIYVGTSRQRVTDRTAQTGRSTAERLDLGGVVVGFVLEHEDPVLFFAVDVHLDLDGAGVDLLALVQIVQLAVRFQLLGSDGCQVHERHGLFASAQFLPDGAVCVIGFLDIVGGNVHVGNLCQECGVAAVVRPVGIDHANLGNGGVAVFGIAEVFLAELNVAEIHCQTVVSDELFQFVLRQGDEAGKGFNCCRNGIVGVQCFRQFRRSFAAFHRIDEILFQAVEFCIGQVAGNDVDICCADTAAFALEQDLDTLLAAVGTLVELSRQVLGRECPLPFFQSRQFCVGVIHRRFRKYGGNGTLESFCRQMICIIAVENANVGDIQTECGLHVAQNRAGFYREFRLFLHINTKNRHGKSPLFWICGCCDVVNWLPFGV